MRLDEKGARELERLVALPTGGHAKTAPRYKVAFVVWTAVFPTVLVLFEFTVPVSRQNAFTARSQADVTTQAFDPAPLVEAIDLLP